MSFISLTLFMNVKYGDVAIESIAYGSAFCYSFSVNKRT